MVRRPTLNTSILPAGVPPIPPGSNQFRSSIRRGGLLKSDSKNEVIINPFT